MSNTRYAVNHHNNAEICAKIDQPVPAELISTRSAGNNNTLSYLKGDIIADRLNEIFGPLGWSAAASPAKIDRFEETRKKQDRSRNMIEVDMVIYVVTTQVTLTIKSQTPDSTDTVFVQTGVGYGEVEANKHAKDAVGMAVKGAETDGLKRCATLLGKAFGMFLTSTGSQDDIDYAHNNNADGKKKAKEIRSKRLAGNNSANQDNRASNNDQRDSREERETPEVGHRNQQTRGKTADQRDRELARQQENKPENRAAPEQKRVQDRREKRAEDAPAQEQAGPPKASAPTNYDLDLEPLTRDDQIAFGSTFVSKLEQAKSKEDKINLFNRHRDTIKNFDGPVLRKIRQHLERHDINMDEVPA